MRPRFHDAKPVDTQIYRTFQGHPMVLSSHLKLSREFRDRCTMNGGIFEGFSRISCIVLSFRCRTNFELDFTCDSCHTPRIVDATVEAPCAGWPPATHQLESLHKLKLSYLVSGKFDLLRLALGLDPLTLRNPRRGSHLIHTISLSIWTRPHLLLQPPTDRFWGTPRPAPSVALPVDKML